MDHSKFPIVIATYHSFLPTLEEFLKSQDDCENLYVSHSDFVLVVDISVIPYLPSEYRVSQAKWVDKMAPVMIRHKIRVVFLTPSVPLQLLIKTMLVITQPKVPYAVVKSLDRALAWAKKQLAMAEKPNV